MKLPYKLYMGDCLEVLKTKKENSIDSIVTDPPYGIGFMGKEWDRIGDTSANYTNLDKPHSYQEKFPMNKSRGRPISETNGKAQQKWHYKWAVEALRVAKPGAFLLAFGGTRTFHRLACAIEDAGWEIRDCIMYVYGSGFPKSLNIGKAVDKKLGNDRTTDSHYLAPDGKFRSSKNHKPNEEIRNKETKYGYKESGFKPTDKGFSEYEGRGTSLKPAWEPIIIARKPVEGTVVDNVLKYGTGGINIDKCRVKYEAKNEQFGKAKTDYGDKEGGFGFYEGSKKQLRTIPPDQGRFPANLIHDGSEEVLELFPNTESGRSNGNAALGVPGNNVPLRRGELISRNDDGSAARFFYCAKTSQKDREKGNYHVTVKPTDLMRYLVKLVTPPNGRVLDMFMGSGSTGKAAILEGFRFIGIEQEEKSFLISEKRIKKSFEKQQLRLFR